MSHDDLVEALSGFIEVRDNGAVIYYDRDGKHHRSNGPAAIQPDGTETWSQHGKLHRTDGPAVMFAEGRCNWYLNGYRMSEEMFNLCIANGHYVKP